jgi:CBS domain-containing protein
MKAADIMTTDVVTVAENATAKDAAALMLRHRVSALPVVDASGKLVGIVSEGDLMRRAEIGTEWEWSWWLELLTSNRTLAEDYIKTHGRKVSQLMTRDIVTAAPDTPINDIALLLERHGIKRVPIVEKGKIVGIVARANLVQALASLKVETPEKQAGKDKQIREEVRDRLKGAPWRPWLLNITVRDGVVELWGVANSAEEKTAAGVAAENAPGVVKVNNHIIVRPHSWAEAKPYLADKS